jgi:N-acetylmuramoyl-L-alanine amidase
MTYSTTLRKSEFVLTKGEDQIIDGYHIEKTDTGIRLMLKHKPKVLNYANPLTGITVMLDAGHGGSESGAIGPLGLRYAEKDINLDFAFKLKAELEALGANVLMTRTNDSYLSLSQRLALSRNARPDMFISLHANSMADNVDISKISGFSVFYSEDFAKPAAQLVYDHVIREHGRNKHGVNKKNFYVIRNTWAPSFLLENAFVPNPIEFEWLTNEAEQIKLAKTVAKAVAEYFK